MDNDGSAIGIAPSASFPLKERKVKKKTKKSRPVIPPIPEHCIMSVANAKRRSRSPLHASGASGSGAVKVNPNGSSGTGASGSGTGSGSGSGSASALTSGRNIYSGREVVPVLSGATAAQKVDGDCEAEI